MAGSRINQFTGRLYAVEQADPVVLVAPTATDVVALSSFLLAGDRQDFVSRNRQGNRSPQGSSAVSERATWSFAQDFMGSGVTGTAPDTEPFFKSVFGQAPTVGSGTVAISALADNGSGLLRVTASTHGLSTGNWIVIHSTATSADGIWRVTAIDANNVDLLESDSTGIATATGTIDKATRVYALSDSCVFLSLWDYNSPGTVRQRAVTGAVAANMTFEFDPQADVSLTLDGSGRWLIDSEQFAGLSTTKKAGLAAYPAQPASPVYTGSGVLARNFRIGVDGLKLTSAIDASMGIATGIEVSTRGANDGLSNGVDTAQRGVTLNFNIFDEDTSTAVANAYSKADSGVRTGVTFAASGGVGLAIALYSPSVLLGKPGTAGEGSRQLSFTGTAGESGSGLQDEMVLVLG